MANQDPLRVVTGRVRLSYVHLFTPRTAPGQNEAKYSVTLLIPKTDMATRQRIDAAIQAAIQVGTEKAWNGIRPPQIPLPIHDGDGVKSDGTPFSPECKGHWVMTASCKTDRKPEIVDINLNPIIDQTQVYSGMYAHVSIRFGAYFSNGKKGIGCYLGNVQKVADGEPLGGGRVSADADFASLAGTAPAPYPQQPAYAPGAQPGYQQPSPAYPPQAGYQQPGGFGQPSPGYQQPPAYGQQPGYAPQAPAPQQPQPQIDPITGRPITGGGIMGL